MAWWIIALGGHSSGSYIRLGVKKFKNSYNRSIHEEKVMT